MPLVDHKFALYLVEENLIRRELAEFAIKVHEREKKQIGHLRIGTLLSGIMGCIRTHDLLRALKDYLATKHQRDDIKTTEILPDEVDFSFVLQFLDQIDLFKKLGYFPMRHDAERDEIIVACLDPFGCNLKNDKRIKGYIHHVIGKFSQDARAINITGLVTPQHRLFETVDGLRFILTMGNNLIAPPRNSPQYLLQDLLKLMEDYRRNSFSPTRLYEISSDFAKSINQVFTSGGSSRVLCGILNSVAMLISNPEKCVRYNKGTCLELQGLLLKLLFSSFRLHVPLLPSLAFFPNLFPGEEMLLIQSIQNMRSIITMIQSAANKDFDEALEWMKKSFSDNDNIHIFSYSCLILRNFYEILAAKPNIKVKLVGSPINYLRDAPYAWRTYYNVLLLQKHPQIQFVPLNQYASILEPDAKLIMGVIHPIPKEYIQGLAGKPDAYLCCERGAEKVVGQFRGSEKIALMGRSKSPNFYAKLGVQQDFRKTVGYFRVYKNSIDSTGSHVLVKAQEFDSFPLADASPEQTGKRVDPL